MDKIVYDVTIDESNHRLAKVSMTFTPKNNLLYMTQGANQLPNRWATFVQNLRQLMLKEILIQLEELSDAQWKLQWSRRKK